MVTALSGAGFGDGYGAGFGDGDAYGYGYGDGYGTGDGDAYGYGYGDGTGHGAPDSDAYAQALLALAPPRPQARLALWRSDRKGRPTNGGRGPTVARVGLMEEVAGPLAICTPRALHASLAPWAHEGARLWIVALYGEVQEKEGKLGALKREILYEIVPNPWP